MIYRMLEYYAMLERKYELPIKQFVIFLGINAPKMPIKIERDRLKFEFPVLSFSEFDYRIFLKSNKPEEIILGLLANFNNESPENALKQIIHRIKETTEGDFSLGKYFNQLRVLAQLRNLELKLKDAMDGIAEYIKEERDVLYLRGLDKGAENARDQELAKFVTNLLQKLNLTFEQIADLAGTSVGFVKSVHRQLNDK